MAHISSVITNRLLSSCYLCNEDDVLRADRSMAATIVAALGLA